jgi:Na+-transporting NADH:ubiquinone oxidoreductase subunit NqrB
MYWDTNGQHRFGWKGDSLQRAMDNSCMFQACENGKPLKSQTVAAMNKCSVKSSVTEDIDSCKSSLVTSLLLIWSLLTTLGLPALPGKSM